MLRREKQAMNTIFYDFTRQQLSLHLKQLVLKFLCFYSVREWLIIFSCFLIYLMVFNQWTQRIFCCMYLVTNKETIFMRHTCCSCTTCLHPTYKYSKFIDFYYSKLTILTFIQAALCSIRIIKKVPDLAENFVNPATGLLREKHHGVLITGVQLCTELCKISSEALEHIRKVLSYLSYNYFVSDIYILQHELVI